MTLLAPTLEGFFTTRLIAQRAASRHTVAAYRDTWRLLLAYLASATGTPPARLDFADLTADRIGAFLDHLQTDRGNSTATRNARLAAIHSLFTYASLRLPEHADSIAQVLAIPAQRRQRRTDIAYLDQAETDALIAAPDQTTAAGRRDHALIATAVTTGLRVSELTGLRRGDVHLGTGPHLVCHGKGRKDRITPLDRRTVAVLRAYQATLPPGQDLLFASRTGTRLSRDAVAARLRLHNATAATTCPTLTGKTVTPHTLRHTAAMRLLHAGVDPAVIALWLGHESVETTGVYLHADLTTKQKALARTRPAGTPPRRFQPDDALLTFLNNL